MCQNVVREFNKLHVYFINYNYNYFIWAVHLWFEMDIADWHEM